MRVLRLIDVLRQLLALTAHQERAGGNEPAAESIRPQPPGPTSGALPSLRRLSSDLGQVIPMQLPPSSPTRLLDREVRRRCREEGARVLYPPYDRATDRRTAGTEGRDAYLRPDLRLRRHVDP